MVNPAFDNIGASWIPDASMRAETRRATPPLALGIDWKPINPEAFTGHHPVFLPACDLFALPGNLGAESQVIGI
jgi:hypothetical protein